MIIQQSSFLSTFLSNTVPEQFCHMILTENRGIYSEV